MKAVRDEDLRVVAAFLERCVVAAGARATFLYASEPESANLWAAAEALRVLAALLVPATPFARYSGLRELGEHVVGALEARDTLLVRDATVAETARGVVTRLVDLTRADAAYAPLRARAERLVAAGGALSYGHGRGADAVPAVGSLKLGLAYLFKSLANTYLSAEPRGAVRVHGGMYTPSDAWVVCAVPGDDDAVALRSLHGRYLALVGRSRRHHTSPDELPDAPHELRIAAVRGPEANAEGTVELPKHAQWHPTRTDDGFVVLRNAAADAGGRCVAADAAGHVLLARAAGGDAMVGYWAAMRCPRSVELSAHEWEAVAVTAPVWCNCCGSFIWGLGTQVHRCRRCHLCVHRACLAAVGDSCESSVLLFGDQALAGTKQQQREREQQEQQQPAMTPEERLLVVSRVCSGPVLTEQQAEEEEAARETLFQTLRGVARANDIACNVFSEADVASSTAGLDIPAPDGSSSAAEPAAAEPAAAEETPKPAAEAKPASPATVRRPQKKLVSSAMRNQLENMMRAGGGMGGMPPMGGARRPSPSPTGTAAEGDTGADKNVVHVGELGIPVTTAPRLQHFNRARGPRRRPPAAAAV